MDRPGERVGGKQVLYALNFSGGTFVQMTTQSRTTLFVAARAGAGVRGASFGPSWHSKAKGFAGLVGDDNLVRTMEDLVIEARTFPTSGPRALLVEA